MGNHKQLNRKKLRKKELSDQFLINGVHTKGNNKIANGFNDFFKNVGPNLSKKFPAITNFEIFFFKTTKFLFISSNK